MTEQTTRRPTGAQVDICICGTDTETGSFEALHWNAPTGSTAIVSSCSPTCSEKIEALRDESRSLTVEAVNVAREVGPLPHIAADDRIVRAEAEVNLDQVVAEIVKLGVPAHVTTTGGNTVTLYAGAPYAPADGEVGMLRTDEMFPAVLGPARFVDGVATADLVDLWLSPDGDFGHEPLDVRTTGAILPRQIAALVAAQVRKSERFNANPMLDDSPLTPDEIREALGYPIGSPSVDEFALRIAQLVVDDAGEMLIKVPDFDLTVPQWWAEMHSQCDANEYDIQAAEDLGIDLRVDNQGHLDYLAAAQEWVPAIVRDLLTSAPAPAPAELMPLMLEAQCPVDGQIFNPADENDLQHVANDDGDPCGATGVLLGEWMSHTTARQVADAPPQPFEVGDRVTRRDVDGLDPLASVVVFEVGKVMLTHGESSDAPLRWVVVATRVVERAPLFKTQTVVKPADEFAKLPAMPDEHRVFTFGCTHTHPDTGASLGGCHVRIPGGTDLARARMLALFGNHWAFDYAPGACGGNAVEVAPPSQAYGLTDDGRRLHPDARRWVDEQIAADVLGRLAADLRYGR